MSNQKINIIERRQVVNSAVASVRAEGLTQSTLTMNRLNLYASGKITAKQLRNETLEEAQSRTTTL